MSYSALAIVILLNLNISPTYAQTGPPGPRGANGANGANAAKGEKDEKGDSSFDISYDAIKKAGYTGTKDEWANLSERRFLSINNSDGDNTLGNYFNDGATGEHAIAIGAGSLASGNNSLAVGFGNQVSGDNSGAFGDPTIITGSGSYSIGNDNNIAADNSFVVGSNVTLATVAENAVALGYNTSVTAENAVALGANSVASEANTVSVGNANNQRRITNVAPGRYATDAVNLSQLQNSEDRLSGGIAGVAAIEQAPYVQGKWIYAVGSAYYNSSAALGVSVRKTTESGRFSTTFGAAGASGGEVIFRAGISGVID